MSSLTTELIIASIVLKRDRSTSLFPVTAQGGTLPLTYSISPALPTGLSLNPLTGGISGAARVESSLTAYTITVTDAASATSFKSFTILVEPSPNKTDPENRIAAADYNYLRTEIRAILDDLGRDNPAARSSAGYGQIMKSSAVNAGNTITKQQWEDLRFDLLNIGLHQSGVIPTIPQIVETIRYSASTPNFRFQDLSFNYFATRFNIGTGRFVLNEPINVSRIGSWTTECSTTLTVDFPGYIRPDSTIISPIDHARYFFNAGGSIRFISSRTDVSGGNTSEQNNAWTRLLSGVGVVQFLGDITRPLGFYKLTSTFQELFRLSPDFPDQAYLGNVYVITARCNVSNNVAGGATQLEFLIRWLDNYVDPDTISGSPLTFPPDDIVDGELSLQIEERQPVGNMQPTGTFTVPGPNYSLSPINFL